MKDFLILARNRPAFHEERLELLREFIQAVDTQADPAPVADVLEERLLLGPGLLARSLALNPEEVADRHNSSVPQGEGLGEDAEDVGDPSLAVKRAEHLSKMPVLFIRHALMRCSASQSRQARTRSVSL